MKTQSGGCQVVALWLFERPSGMSYLQLCIQRLLASLVSYTMFCQVLLVDSPPADVQYCSQSSGSSSSSSSRAPERGFIWPLCSLEGCSNLLWFIFKFPGIRISIRCWSFLRGLEQNHRLILWLVYSLCAAEIRWETLFDATMFLK